MLHFYSLTPAQVNALMLKTFWLMALNIDRIQAQNDMRALTVAAAAQSTEGATQVRQRLQVEIGEIVVIDKVAASVQETLDRDGLDELRNLSD